MRKTFKEITSRLSDLSRREMRELKAMLEVLLSMEMEEQDEVILRHYNGIDKRGNTGAGGHIERKRINGYGPYLYLRYWSGKKLKSIYIGKAKGKS